MAWYLFIDVGCSTHFPSSSMSGNNNNNNNSYSFPIIISELLGAVVLIGMVNGENICSSALSWMVRGGSSSRRHMHIKISSSNDDNILFGLIILDKKMARLPYPPLCHQLQQQLPCGSIGQKSSPRIQVYKAQDPSVESTHAFCKLPIRWKNKNLSLREICPPWQLHATTI